MDTDETTDFVSEENGRVTMCCGGKKCPVLAKNSEWITIKDDFGNEVKIPRSQQHAFVEAVGRLFL